MEVMNMLNSEVSVLPNNFQKEYQIPELHLSTFIKTMILVGRIFSSERDKHSICLP